MLRAGGTSSRLPPLHFCHTLRRYYGKGMRIDLFMVQGGLLRRVEAACVCGRGADMQGFLGSDHSPVVLRMREGVWCGAVVVVMLLRSVN